MKRIILALVLIATTFGAAFAQGYTKTENDAAIVAMHQQIATKVTQLETTLKANNIQAAQTAADELLVLLQRGMRLGDKRIQLEPTADKKTAANQKYLQMEMANHEYRKLSTNVATNGNQMVQKAKAFLNVY